MSANEVSNVVSPVVEFVPFPPGVYAGTQISQDFDNPYWNSGLFTFNFTAYGSVGTTTVELLVKDPSSGLYFLLASKTLTAAGQVGFNVGFGAAAVGGYTPIQCAMPRTFQIKIVPPDGNNNTYSVGASLSR